MGGRLHGNDPAEAPSVVASVDRAVVLGRQGEVLWASVGFAASRGLPGADLTGVPCFEALHGADRPCPDAEGGVCPARLARISGRRVRAEHRHALSSGARVDEAVFARPFRLDGRRARGAVLLALHDLTLRKRLLDGPLAGVPGIDALLRGGRGGEVRLRPDSTVEAVDEAAAATLGRMLDRGVPRSFPSMFTGRSREAMHLLLSEGRDGRATGLWADLELHVPGRRGVPVEVSVEGLSVRLRRPVDVRGEEACTSVVCRALASVATTPGAAALVVSRTGLVTLAFGAVEQVLGRRPDEVVGRARLEDLHPGFGLRALLAAACPPSVPQEGSEQPRLPVAATREGGGPVEILVEPSVAAEAVDDAAAILVYSSPEAAGPAMEGLDAETKFRRLFEAVKQGVFFSTRAGRFVDFNPALQEMLGYESRQELLGIELARDLYVDPADRAAFQRRVAAEGYVKDLEITFLKKGGEHITVELTGHALTDRVGKTVGYQGLINDVTAQRQLQQQLVQAEKLATIGALAAGVAHELNNPLGGILVFGHLLLEQTSPGDPGRRHAERIVAQASRCKEIIRGLLQFSRPALDTMRSTDVNSALRAALGLLECQALFENVTVRWDLAPDLAQVTGNGAQLEQVFANIALNAAEAMGGRGEISIGTCRSGDGRHVLVRIADDGPGMSEEVRRRVFEPFFTTKTRSGSGSGSGSGLGLAVSHGIVMAHQGVVEIESEFGRGTTFEVRLPALEGGR